MKVRLTDRDIQEIIYERNVPVNFKSDKGFEEKSFALDHRYGKYQFTQQWFDGIHINEGKLSMNENVLMCMESYAPMIEMHFSLSGVSNVSMEGSKEKMTIGSRDHNIFYLPCFNGYMETGKQASPNHAFEVCMTEDYFQKIVGCEYTALEGFTDKIEKKEMALLSRQNLVITAQMDALIHDIINCRKQGTLKRLYIESKVLQLLVLQVEQYESTCTQTSCSCIKHYDVQKMYYAKELLEKNISNPHSLAELARLTGLNEFKLKKGFKELFGNTVFGYLHELRMEEAKRLLLDQDMPINIVAEYCGYQYVSHFTTAFRKKHGITPAKFRA